MELLEEEEVYEKNVMPPKTCYRLVPQFFVEEVVDYRKQDTVEDYMVKYENGIKQWWGPEEFEAIQHLIDQFNGRKRTMREEPATPVQEQQISSPSSISSASSSSSTAGPPPSYPRKSRRKRSKPMQCEEVEIGPSPDPATISKRKKLPVSRKGTPEPTEQTDGKPSCPAEPDRETHVKMEETAKEIGHRVTKDVDCLVQAVASHQKEIKRLKEELEKIENQLKDQEKVLEEKAELGRELEQLKEKAEKEEKDAVKFWKDLLGEGGNHQGSHQVEVLKNKVKKLVKWAIGLKNYVYNQNLGH